MRSRFGTTAIAVAGLVALTACGTSDDGAVVCPAIGYTSMDPIELRLGPELPDDVTVAACFDEGCDPVGLQRDPKGRWLVPQNPEYFGEGDESWVRGDVHEVLVAVTDAPGELLHEAVHPVPRVTEWQGRCPGPFTYEPVDVP